MPRGPTPARTAAIPPSCARRRGPLSSDRVIIPRPSSPGDAPSRRPPAPRRDDRAYQRDAHPSFPRTRPCGDATARPRAIAAPVAMGRGVVPVQRPHPDARRCTEFPRARRRVGRPRAGRGAVCSRALRQPEGPRILPPPRAAAPFRPSIQVWLRVWTVGSTPPGGGGGGPGGPPPPPPTPGYSGRSGRQHGVGSREPRRPTNRPPRGAPTRRGAVRARATALGVALSRRGTGTPTPDSRTARRSRAPGAAPLAEGARRLPPIPPEQRMPALPERADHQHLPGRLRATRSFKTLIGARMLCLHAQRARSLLRSGTAARGWIGRAGTTNSARMGRANGRSADTMTPTSHDPTPSPQLFLNTHRLPHPCTTQENLAGSYPTRAAGSSSSR